MKKLLHVITLISAVVLAVPAVAQQQENNQATANPLVQLLQSKGILTVEEAALVGQTSSRDEANQRLAHLLLSKGLISQKEYQATINAPAVQAAADVSTDVRMIPAVLRIPAVPRTNDAEPAVPAAAHTAVPTIAPDAAPPVIPAVAPLRVLPIDVPKQGGLIPDIKLGSGARLKVYGFFKASAIEDTANAGGGNFGGDDFPLPLLQGDTGPTAGPEFHVKSRSFRMGANFEWVPEKSNVAVTGRFEYDFEGDFTNVNNRNISGVRSSTPSIRLAWARLDTKLSDNVSWFGLFGQDWTILGSSTLPSLFEGTGLGLGMGSFYERVPQFRTGLQFGGGTFKVQPEVAIVLPVAGNAALTADQRARFGDRAGSDSNQPGLQARLVFQFPLASTWKGVAPAQFIVSGGHARFDEIIPASALSNLAVTNAAGCTQTVSPTDRRCSVLGFFPRGLDLSSPQNIWTAEAQLPTPWVTFVAKYYHGGDMRFYFSGQLNDVFPDLTGAFPIPTSNGTALSFNNRAITFGCPKGDNSEGFTCNGPIIASTLRPVRGQGGFAEMSFPLSRIFNANPDGHNSGWVFRVGYGTDRAKASEARRGNGLVRTDLSSASLTYKLNKWVSFVNEVGYIQTRAANRGGKVFKGLPATQAHAWRNEFGTIFIF